MKGRLSIDEDAVLTVWKSSSFVEHIIQAIQPMSHGIDGEERMEHSLLVVDLVVHPWMFC